MNVLSRLAATGRYWLGRLGWPSVLGLALLIGTALGYPLAMADLAARQAGTDAELATRRQQLRAVQATTGPGGTEQRPAVYRQLPAPAAAEATVRYLHESAQAHGIQIADSEYRAGRMGTAGLFRYQMTLPLRGSYPQIRRWLAAAMNREPALAIEEITLTRDQPGAAEIGARLRLTLFLRAA